MKQKNLEQKTQVTEEQNAAKVENEPGTKEPSTSSPPPGQKERRFRQTDLPAHFIERRKHPRSEEHTSELQSLRHLVCRLLLEKKKQEKNSRLPYACDQAETVWRNSQWAAH